MKKIRMTKLYLLILALCVLAGLTYLDIASHQDRISTKQKEFTQEMDSIASSLPNNYHMTPAIDYTPSGFENDAVYKRTFTVSGTREAVFKQIIKSLRLNPAHDADSSDQTIVVAASPKYKYAFGIFIEPTETRDEGIKLCPNAATDQAYHDCLNSIPNHGKNAQAQTIEIDITNQK